MLFSLHSGGITSLPGSIVIPVRDQGSMKPFVTSSYSDFGTILVSSVLFPFRDRVELDLPLTERTGRARRREADDECP